MSMKFDFMEEMLFVLTDWLFG